MALLNNELAKYKIILASNSPRRRELMAGAGIDFVLADKYDVDEVWSDGMPAGEVAGYLSALKSEKCPYCLKDNEILITADTVVLLGERVLGKPVGRGEAIDMLASLSGNKHTVVTGVTLRDNIRTRTFAVATDVWFRELKLEEIEFYVDNYQPFDKAGAYGIQEWIGYVAIEKIDGSFYNVMGLPVQALYKELGDFISR